MAVQFEVGEKYRNRRGEYEVLEITSDGRLKVRYTQDGVLADLDKEQQARIIDNIQLETAAQAKLVSSAPAPKAARTAPAKPAVGTNRRSSPARPERSATSMPAPRAAPVPRRPENHRGASEALPAVELKPLVVVRKEFTKLEVLKLLQHIGFGNPDGMFWFIGNSDLASSDGNAILSERLLLPEFQKEFADTAIYKRRFISEAGSFYGSPAWQYANYIVSRLRLPQDEQTEEARHNYFTNQFGALDGDVLLTDILSLPARSTSANQWPYRHTTITDSPLYNTVIRDPQRFLEDQLTGRETRVRRLKELYDGVKIQKTAPKFVFCYGRSAQWRYFKDIFPHIQVYTEMELASYSDKDRQVRSAIGRDEDNGTLIVLLPSLTPQEGITYHYLDQLIALLQRLVPRL